MSNDGRQQMSVTDGSVETEESQTRTSALNDSGQNAPAANSSARTDQRKTGRVKRRELPKGALDLIKRHGTTSAKLPEELSQILREYFSQAKQQGTAGG